VLTEQLMNLLGRALKPFHRLPTPGSASPARVPRRRAPAWPVAATPDRRGGATRGPRAVWHAWSTAGPPTANRSRRARPGTGRYPTQRAPPPARRTDAAAPRAAGPGWPGRARRVAVPGASVPRGAAAAMGDWR
jgi:hypothetical protein